MADKPKKKSIAERRAEQAALDRQSAAARADAPVAIPAPDEAGIDAMVQAAKASLPKNIAMFARKEFKILPDQLADGERILDVCQGTYAGKQGLLVATDRRVMYLEAGMMRTTVEDFPYDRISSVQTKKGALFGKLVIHASGNNAEIGQVAPPDRAERVGAIIRDHIGTPKGPSVPQPSADSPLDKLKKLGDLRDAGVISDEEFEAKKTQLLEQI